jgi:hypothetical protein
VVEAERKKGEELKRKIEREERHQEELVRTP